MNESTGSGPGSPGQEELEREVLRSLRRIIQAVDLHGRRLSARHGLTGPQNICLREIQRCGPLNPGELARSVALKPPTVSGILDRLEARGLVTRRRRDDDKRQVRVKLTPAGEAVLAQTPPPLQELFTERLAALPADRRRSIADALQNVVELLEAEGIEAAPLLARGSANPAVSDFPAEPTEPGHRRRTRTG